MGEQGAALQKYNQELVKCIEALKIKRNEVLCEIEKEETVKSELESKLSIIKSQLDDVNASLRKKYDIRQSYDSAIKESEVAYMKILESSEVLLNKVRRDSEIIEDNNYI